MTNQNLALLFDFEKNMNEMAIFFQSYIVCILFVDAPLTWSTGCLRKYEQSVLQSLCSINQHFLDLFISLYAIHISWKCAKLKEIKAWKLYIINLYHTKLMGERWERIPNSTQNIDCLHRGGMPL